jgi:methyl-accepting chemotaxis protein
MEWLNKQSFTRLIITAIAIIILPVVVMVYLVYGQIMGMKHAIETMQADQAVYTTISEFSEASGATQTSLYNLIGFRQQEDVPVFKEHMARADAQVGKLKEIASQKVTADNDTTVALTKALLDRWTEYDSAAEAVSVKYTDKKYVQGSLGKLEAAQKDLTAAIAKSHDEVSVDIKEDVQLLNNALSDILGVSTKALIANIIIIVLMMLLIRFNILNRLKISFSEFKEASEKLTRASRDLAGNSDIISQTTSQITSAITQVASGATEQSSGAVDALQLVEQIAGAVDQVSKSAQTQVASVDEMARGMGQLADSITQVSESANVVAGVVEEASAVASKGKGAVDETIEGMQRIKSSVLDTAYKIETLGEKSKQIGEIIEVIDDIAEQTNLLALNAAIEAARAGEHGKGFAVVADEVRKLAERSARATGEIADLIKSIQDETMDAVETMEKGTTEVENGSNLAEHAGTAIEEMMGSIKQVVTQIAQVAEYADNMAAASSQVTRAVEQIAAISQENSATAEEVSSSTSQVVSAIDSIAASSQESAASAEEVSASTEEQSASIEEMSTQIQSLASMSDDLAKVVNGIKI